MRILLSCQLGRRSLTGANRYQVSRSPTSWVVPLAPNPLKWQVAQVGAGKSFTVSVPGSASQFQVWPSGRVGDPVRRFLVDLPLGMIRADVAGVAGFGLARLLQAELVAQVALGALADAAIHLGLSDRSGRFRRQTG